MRPGGRAGGGIALGHGPARKTEPLAAARGCGHRGGCRDQSLAGAAPRSVADAASIARHLRPDAMISRPLMPREASLTPPPLRGISGREIMASGRLVDGVFTASWKPVRGARSYRVQIFDSIGEPVTWTETSKTTVSATIGSAPPGQTRYWKVQALDDDHIVIASSELLKIQTP